MNLFAVGTDIQIWRIKHCLLRITGKKCYWTPACLSFIFPFFLLFFLSLSFPSFHPLSLPPSFCLPSLLPSLLFLSSFLSSVLLFSFFLFPSLLLLPLFSPTVLPFLPPSSFLPSPSPSTPSLCVLFSYFITQTKHGRRSENNRPPQRTG